jgi:hypothetical protein
MSNPDKYLLNFLIFKMKNSTVTIHVRFNGWLLILIFELIKVLEPG